MFLLKNINMKYKIKRICFAKDQQRPSPNKTSHFSEPSKNSNCFDKMQILEDLAQFEIIFFTSVSFFLSTGKESLCF